MTNKQAQITINAIKFMLDNAQYSEDVEEALNMAINALTAQQAAETHDKCTETHACDCVSRQMALDALEKLSANYTGVGKREWHPHVRECQYEIEHLPSAQPELTDEDMKLIKQLRSYHNGSYAKVIDKLLAVPSAQPDLSSYSDKLWRNAYERGKAEAEEEIIRCKDCKWKQGAECVRFAEVRPFPNDFCSRAERKER